MTFAVISFGSALPADTNEYPNTFLVLASNAAADCLTIGITAVILSRIARVPDISSLLLIGADVSASAALSVFSLWWSLQGTAQELSLAQCIDVLIAKNPHGGGWELGTYFFLSHSVFLPTVIFLVILFFFCLVKMVTDFVCFILARTALEEVNPYTIFSGACGVLTAAATLAATIAMHVVPNWK